MLNNKWSVAEAKSKFSKLIEKSKKNPQLILNRNREVAVVLDISDFCRLKESAAQSGPTEKIARFLKLSAQVREEGGVELKISQRKTRRPPFEVDDLG